MAYKHSLEINEYRGWLIITVTGMGATGFAKMKPVGIGTLFSNFNKLDVRISKNALSIITENLTKNKEQRDPVLEIIAKDRIWWASTQGIIIPPKEIFNIYEIPLHTECENVVDQKVRDAIDNQK